MFKSIVPKLPMRNKHVTADFYINKLGFQQLGTTDFDGYLMVVKETVEIHFFEFKNLNPNENYGQVYIRTQHINQLYNSFIEHQIVIHPNGKLQTKPWGQLEFSILDPDHNLLTFGESI